jgi:hypothetical protein
MATQRKSPYHLEVEPIGLREDQGNHLGLPCSISEL